MGAIFVDSDARILSTGYNGVPRHHDHCLNPETRCDGFKEPPGTTNHCLAVHAEQNAIMQCLDLDQVVTLYCSASPCFVCTRMLLNLKNLDRVVFHDLYPDEAALRLWRPLERLEHWDNNGQRWYLSRQHEHQLTWLPL